MKKTILLMLAAILSLTTCQKDEQSNITDSGTDQALLLNLINEKRTDGCNCGDTYMPPVEPVQWDENLAEAALAHSTDMHTNEHFSHDGTDGSSFSERVAETDFDGFARSENIASGYESEEDLIEGWLNSPGHCLNIMNATVTHMGVGRSGNYWTQLFGKR